MPKLFVISILWLVTISAVVKGLMVWELTTHSIEKFWQQQYLFESCHRYHSGELYSDEPPLESQLHLKQILLLLSCLEWLWRDRNDFYAAGNMTIYYSQDKIKNRDFRGPDFFVVLDTNQRVRKSWILWEEDGKYPNFILEIMSESTEKLIGN